MPTGTCKWFSKQKGYGFLIPATGGKDIFLHISALEKSGLKTLKDGQRVSFDLAPDRDGRNCAVNLKVVA